MDGVLVLKLVLWSVTVDKELRQTSCAAGQRGQHNVVAHAGSTQPAAVQAALQEAVRIQAVGPAIQPAGDAAHMSAVLSEAYSYMAEVVLVKLLHPVPGDMKSTETFVVGPFVGA